VSDASHMIWSPWAT